MNGLGRKADQYHIQFNQSTVKLIPEKNCFDRYKCQDDTECLRNMIAQ